MKDGPTVRRASLLLRARWLAFWHSLFGMFTGHRIVRLEEKPAHAIFYRTTRIGCICGREFH